LHAVFCGKILPGNNDIWEWDPVHPTATGYEKVCDLIEEEFEKFPLGGFRKRPVENQTILEDKNRRVEVPRPR
jgi:hypothetical protein